MKNVVIYTGPFCNYCDAAKRLLTRNNAPFKDPKPPTTITTKTIATGIDIIPNILFINLFILLRNLYNAINFPNNTANTLYFYNNL